MSSAAYEMEKLRVARAAASLVREDATVALGSGSTAHLAIQALAARFPGGAGIRCVASSHRSEEIARRHALQIVPLEEVVRFDIMLDGADEVAPNLTLIKGGGGALFREKLLARMSDKVVIMVDQSKLVRRLGTRSPLPVEVVPFAVPYVARELSRQGLLPTLRMSSATAEEGEALPFVTDNGNHILDCRVPPEVPQERAFDQALRSCAGVVETGLFVELAHVVLVGLSDGRVEELHPRAREARATVPSLLEEALNERIQAPAVVAGAAATSSGRRSPDAKRPPSKPRRRRGTSR